jgi:LysR family carnitine catabolism transcriptional activator
MVIDGSADFGISIAPLQHDDIQYEPLLQDEFVLICAKNDPLSLRDKLDWSVFADRPFIASGPASSIRSITERVLTATGLEIRPRYESANISVLGAMVAAGLGIAAIPKLSIRLLDMTRITTVPLIEPAIFREIGILTRKRRSLSAAATIFLETIRSHRQDWLSVFAALSR